MASEQLDAILQKLPLLQHLCIDGRQTFRNKFPASSISCRRLRCLQIRGGSMGAVRSELSLLTALTQLDLRVSYTTSLPDSISCLSRLVELDLRGSFNFALPWGLSACRQLTRLRMDSDCASPVLGNLGSLRYLSVTVTWELQEGYWSRLTALTELRLRCCEMRGIHPGLGALKCLRRLCIEGALFKGMPEGPYLRCLESLLLVECRFPSGVPAVLAAATQLRHLCVSGEFDDSDYYGGGCVGTDNDYPIKLNVCDIAVLSSIPALETLGLPQPECIEEDEWAERLAQLRAACIVRGHAPPACSE